MGFREPGWDARVGASDPVFYETAAAAIAAVADPAAQSTQRFPVRDGREAFHGW